MHFKKSTLVARCSALAMLAGGALSVGEAAAQTAPDTGEADAVVVTGTSIRGVAPVGSNLVEVSRDTLKLTSSQTITGALASIPALSGITEQATTTAFFQPSIHQLGASASNSTLVLLDGHRGPTGGTNHTFLDPNIIPNIMIDRVDVLAEGASSIYGSDAVAGVINFITRRRFNGALAEGSVVARDGSLGYSSGLLFGGTWDKAWLTMGAEFNYQDRLKASDRDYTYPDQRPNGGGNFLTRNCAPAAIQPGAAGNIYLSPTSTTSVANTADNYKCSNWSTNDLVGAQTRMNLMAKGGIDLTERLTIGLDMLAAKRRGRERTSAGSVQATVFRTGAQANPFYVNPPGVLPGTTAGDRQVITWDATDLVGPAVNNENSDTYYANFTATYKLTDDWNVDLLASSGQDESLTAASGVVNTSVANLALNGTTNGGGNVATESIPGTGVAFLTLPLTAANSLDVWNPSATNRTSAAVIRDLLDNERRLINDSNYSQVRASVGGPLFQMPAGPLNVAVGGELLKTGLEQDRTLPDNTGPASRGSYHYIYRFRREVYSGFAELSVPLISPEMNSFIHRLDVSIAGRYDHYSDFGSTSNPKLAFNLDPVEGLRIRGNWSTSFVAPPLTVLGKAFNNNGGTTGTNSISVPVSAYPDVVKIIPSCAGQQLCNISALQGIAVASGDPNAKAQKGKGWSLGFDTSPALIPGLTTALTYWNTSFEGGITGLNINNIVNNSNVQYLLTFYPNCATLAQIIQQIGDRPQNNALAACTSYISQTKNTNWLNLYAAGIDYSIGYDLETDAGTWSAGLSGTEFTKYDQSVGIGNPAFDVLNTAGAAGTFPQIKRKARAYVGWGKDNLQVRMFVNHTGGFRNWSASSITPITRDANGNPNGGGDSVAALTTYDLNLSYEFGGGLLDRAKISLAATNLTDERPPFFNASNGYYNNGGFNPFGRTLNLTVSKRF
jgi:iron complex outermembrane recepter protein